MIQDLNIPSDASSSALAIKQCVGLEESASPIFPSSVIYNGQFLFDLSENRVTVILQG